MAITATLVSAGHNNLRYLLSDDGGGGTTVTITSAGTATPDLVTDSLSGPVKACANAFTAGLGKLAAGAKTQAQSRAIWNAQDSDSVLGTKVSRCLTRLETRSGANPWSVDCNVDGGGIPTIVATHGAAAAGTAYLDIQTQGPIGR